MAKTIGGAILSGLAAMVALPGTAMAQVACGPSAVVYQQSINVTPSQALCPGLRVCTQSFAQVPSGQRLILTYASASFAAIAQTGAAVATIYGNDDQQIALPTTQAGALGFVAASPVTFYIDGGQIGAAPKMSVASNFFPGASVIMTLVGCVVPVVRVLRPPIR